MNNSGMKKSRGASLTTRDIISVIAVILVVFITVLFIALNFNSENRATSVGTRYESFSKGWNLEVGERKELVDLPVYVEAGEYESIILSKELPLVAPYYAIVGRNYHQKLLVYVDGELEFEYPSEKLVFSDATMTDDWNMVYLDESMTGKTVTMEFKTGSYGYKGYIKPSYIGEDNSVIQYIRSITVFPYGMSISVIAIGATLIILGIIYSKYNTDRTQIISGLMLVTIGIWITNRSKMPFLLEGSNIKYFLAFISLSLESILILLYVWEKFKNKRDAITSKLIVIFSIYLVAVIGISLGKGYPLDQIIRFIYAAIFFAALYMIVMLWPSSYGKDSVKLSEKERTANRMEFYAANIMTFGVVIGIVFDFLLNNNRLWTDIGTLPKIVLNIYAVIQIIIHIYRSYNDVIEREEIRGQLHNSQLELMMGQIQPHFVFNTLSSIRTLVKVDPDLAYDMIYNFSNYLRANVDNMTNLGGIMFAAELDHIKSYVNIEKVRFGDRLHVQYDAQYTEFMVPPLSIQPIVENAIKHGVCKKLGGGTVWLRSYQEAHYNVVEVEDNGVGFNPDLLASLKNARLGKDLDNQKNNLTGNGSESHKSTGMKNIMMRLKEMANADMEIDSVEGEGTKIKILFPIE